MILNEISNKELNLSYPCLWSYVIIGKEEQKIKNIIKNIIKKKHNLKLKNSSKNGRFISFELSLIVDSEAERISIFSQLNNSKEILQVL